MNFQPSNFYIGIIDLFAILLPGVVASLITYHFYQTDIDKFIIISKEYKSFYYGFLLLFSSYMLGHMISQVSAYLDEWIYDVLKGRVYTDNKRLNEAKIIREVVYGNDLNSNYVNTYNWCIFKIKKEQPQEAAEIERYIADSKFFRGLFVVLAVILIILSYSYSVIITSIGLSLFIPTKLTPQMALKLTPLMAPS